MSSALPSTPIIKASLVPGHLRSTTLPKRFPGLFLVFEMTVHCYMDKLVKPCSGGYWEYIELSNGGFYMSLISNQSFRVEVDSNCFEGTMSANAASLVANLFAYRQLANQHKIDYLIEGFHTLRRYACMHPEGNLILAAIETATD